MLNMCLISLIMIFCVLGIYFLAKEIVSLSSKNNVKSCVILELNDSINETENILRSALAANPNSEIVIVDKSGSNEIEKILHKFSDDNSRVHIKTAPEK